MTKMTLKASNDNHDVEAALHAAFRQAVTERVGPNADFAAREVAGLELANELCREDQQEELLRRSVMFMGDEVWIDGKRYKRHDKTKLRNGHYHGLCGGLMVPCALFREADVRNGPTVVPLELDAGLMERMTPALANAVGHGYAWDPSRTTHEAMLVVHRVPPSRSTTERAAKRLGAAMEDAMDHIEPLIRVQETLPEGAVGISIGLDRTSVPMEEPASPDKKPSKRTAPYIRAVPAPIEVNYRMAYVGTLSVFDRDGRALLTRRYGIAGDRDPEELVARLQVDLRHLHAQDPSLSVVALMDGAPEMWKLVRAGLRAETSVSTWDEAIDWHHVTERFADAMRCAKLTKGWRDKQLAAWSKMLDEDDDAIDHIEQYIISLRDGACGDARVKLDDHVTFIANNKDRMRYATLRAKRFPVGSGVTEGACKSLVMIRAKACGQRWHDDGIDALLVLRGLLLSDRLPQAIILLRRDYTATVRLAA
jgi:hypothetical protein